MTRRNQYRSYLNSSEWKEVRACALERTSGFCQFCGAVATQVHHSKYPKQFGDEHPNSLIPICKKCHDISHGIQKMKQITDATRMSDLSPNGMNLKYILSGGRVYASAKSWSRALKIPSEMTTWFESGLSRTALLKGGAGDSGYEMEYLNTPVYRWHAVAEQLRVFDRKWHQDQYAGRPRFEREKIKQFHENYEKLVNWGYDLQERALSSILEPLNTSKTAVTQENLIAAIKEAVAPRLVQHDQKLTEHDLVIAEIQNVVPVLRDEGEFITIRQAIAEQGLDAETMPFFPESKLNLSGLTGQSLSKEGVEVGGKVNSRMDGSSQRMEINTYRRGVIYEKLKEILAINNS